MTQNGVQAGETGTRDDIPAPTSVEKTDWTGLFLTLLTPAILIAGLTCLLLQPPWEDSESVEWLDGLVAVIPLEFVRILVLRILRDTYREYQSPRRAVQFFLLSFGVLVGICFVMALMSMGTRLFIALADARSWQLILPPLLFIVLDGVINLVFFRGDHTRVAAQLDAAADDAESWFGLALYPTPIFVILGYGALFYLHTLGVAFLQHFPTPDIGPLRAVFLGYAIVYLSGKAIVIAHVYSAHFLRSGRRLLGVAWVDFLAGKNAEQRAANAAAEARAADRRLRELRGAPIEASPSARERRRRVRSA